MKTKFFLEEELSQLETLQIRGGVGDSPLDTNVDCKQANCVLNKGSKCPGDTNTGNCVNTSCLVYQTDCNCIAPPNVQCMTCNS